MKPPTPRLKFNATQLIAWLALFVSLGGTVYAATQIDGRTIRRESIPANRIKADSLGRAQVNEASLGTVPSASTADEAQSAAFAATARTAAKADRAVNASKASQAGSAGFAAVAEEAESADFATQANRTDMLGEIPADKYLSRCATGVPTAMARVIPNATDPVPRVLEAFSCNGDSTAITVEKFKFEGRLITGAYTVSLGDKVCNLVVASTEAPNTAALSGPSSSGNGCAVTTYSTVTGDNLPNVSFTIVVF